MHEFAVTEGLLEIVQAEARKAGARKVSEVHVTIGELSTFVDRSIEFYFTELSRGTLAEGAELVFTTVEASAWCDLCDIEFHPDSAFVTCPECHSPVPVLSRGQELYVDSIEVG
ncbi:MAG: hydrogenase maturation nickel metallochaperone HypA [Gaiellales bacterium]|nr:MAG: hydrogenase maturation nickel metallochaperone HypA [Gaiellales bacterium]